ncbi:MAG: Hsp20/alpha crystallin family protein [Verrucomicrobiota bacterium]|jgi:HSP20 family protein
MKLQRLRRPESNWSLLDEQLSTLRDEINRLFQSPLGDFNGASEFFNTWTPAIDLYEDKDHLIVRAELPGMKKEEIEVSLHNGNITVSGERKIEQKEEGESSRSERFFGRFQRSLTLPKPVEASKVKAVYKDGILTVTLPKTEEAKPKQIEVQVS